MRSCPLVLPRPDGQEREGPLSPDEGPITGGLQPFTTPGMDRGPDSTVGGRMQAPEVPLHLICHLGNRGSRVLAAGPKRGNSSGAAYEWVLCFRSPWEKAVALFLKQSLLGI